jgi:hypothetical protein
MAVFNVLLAAVPLLPSIYLMTHITGLFVCTNIFKAVGVGVAGYWLTCQLIPVVAEYTLKKGGLSFILYVDGALIYNIIDVLWDRVIRQGLRKERYGP